MRDTVADLILVLGASLRLTRLVTTDTLPEWLVIRHVRAWGARHELEEQKRHPLFYPRERDPLTWQQELVSGLDCPYCFGTWIGFGVLGSWVLARRHPTSHAVWRFFMGGLAMNYVTGHISSALEESHE